MEFRPGVVQLTLRPPGPNFPFGRGKLDSLCRARRIRNRANQRERPYCGELLYVLFYVCIYIYIY